MFGEFSSKFAAAAKDAPMIGDPTVIKAEPGSHPQAVAESGVDAYALTHNETSTGVSMPIIRPADTEGALVLVDATSAAGGLDLDISQSDVYYFAPQKSFASDGGLWVAIMSPAAIARIEKIKASGRWAGETLYKDSRDQETDASIENLWKTVEQIGGTTGWYGCSC